MTGLFRSTILKRYEQQFGTDNKRSEPLLYGIHLVTFYLEVFLNDVKGQRDAEETRGGGMTNSGHKKAGRSI